MAFGSGQTTGSMPEKRKQMLKCYGTFEKITHWSIPFSFPQTSANMALDLQSFPWLLLSYGFLKGEAARHVWSLFSFIKSVTARLWEYITSAKSALECCSVLFVTEASAWSITLTHKLPTPKHTLNVFESFLEKAPDLADGHTYPKTNELRGAKLSSKFPRL